MADVLGIRGNILRCILAAHHEAIHMHFQTTPRRRITEADSGTVDSLNSGRNHASLCIRAIQEAIDVVIATCIADTHLNVGDRDSESARGGSSDGARKDHACQGALSNDDAGRVEMDIVSSRARDAGIVLVGEEVHRTATALAGLVNEAHPHCRLENLQQRGEQANLGTLHLLFLSFGIAHYRIVGAEGLFPVDGITHEVTDLAITTIEKHIVFHCSSDFSLAGRFLAFVVPSAPRMAVRMAMATSIMTFQLMSLFLSIWILILID